jgi:hypothetical protein
MTVGLLPLWKMPDMIDKEVADYIHSDNIFVCGFSQETLLRTRFSRWAVTGTVRKNGGTDAGLSPAREKCIFSSGRLNPTALDNHHYPEKIDFYVRAF